MIRGKIAGLQFAFRCEVKELGMNHSPFERGVDLNGTNIYF